jgi:hypothetical protein
MKMSDKGKSEEMKVAKDIYFPTSETHFILTLFFALCSLFEEVVSKSDCT